MNERIKWIQHKGKRILFVDQSDIRDEAEALKLIDAVEKEILTLPKGHKALTIYYSKNSIVTSAISERSKQLVANINAQGIPTGPSAIVGSAGFQKAVVQMMQIFIKDLHLADTIEEAKDWLIAQKTE